VRARQCFSSTSSYFPSALFLLFLRHDCPAPTLLGWLIGPFVPRFWFGWTSQGARGRERELYLAFWLASTIGTLREPTDTIIQQQHNNRTIKSTSNINTQPSSRGLELLSNTAKLSACLFWHGAYSST